MKKYIVIFSLLFLVLSAKPTFAKVGYTYTDVTESNSHYESINFLWTNGLIGGYRGEEKGTLIFKPNEYITRLDAAAIFYRVLDLPDSDNYEETLSMYKDLPTNHFLAIPLASVIEKGIFKGSNGYFNTGEMSREQMATTIVSAFGLEYDPNNKVEINLSNVSESHRLSVEILAQYNITTALDDFRPKEKVTRAQFITFLYAAMKVTGLEQYKNINYDFPNYYSKDVKSRMHLHESWYVYRNAVSNLVLTTSGLNMDEARDFLSYVVAFPNTPIIYKNVEAVLNPETEQISMIVYKD